MRGFVITILSMALILILVVLSLSFRNAQLSTERELLEPLPLIYAAFLVDDVAYEFNSIVGPHLDLDERNDSIRLSVMDRLHNFNHSAAILNYEAFLRGEVADRTTSQITTNFTNLSGDILTVFIAEDYIYANNHATNESIFTKAGGTGASSYDINLTVIAARANVTHIQFNDSGTLNVTIRYFDLNGTVLEEGRVFPNHPNTMQVDYADGSSVKVIVGQAGGNSGSLFMKASGIAADASWSAILPPLEATRKLGYEYDATIDYVQGGVAKHCRIGK